VGNLPSTLLKDFVITAKLSGGDAGCCVIKDCVITATTSGGDWHVWACSILGEEPVLTQTHPPPKMSVTDTGSSPKSLLFYYVWILYFNSFISCRNSSIVS
jgi:hypothetical protein